jgi:multicomponent Na+:H+ antiporter subunit D
MPFTMVAFTLATFSIIGLPPFGGSWSKWYLALGAAKSGHLVFVGVLMISTLLNIAYLVPIAIRGFYFSPASGDTRVKEAPLMCVVPLCLTAVGSCLLFFFAEPIYTALIPIASS